MLSLKEFLNKYGDDTTSNFDLISWSKQLGIPKMKVVMKNELHKLNGRYIICNYQTSDFVGTHWIAMYKDTDQAFYFNSFGTQPFKEAMDYLGPKHMYSTFQIQKLNQKCCGQLCLYFLYSLHNKKSYIDTIFDMLFWSLKNEL